MKLNYLVLSYVERALHGYLIHPQNTHGLSAVQSLPPPIYFLRL